MAKRTKKLEKGIESIKKEIGKHFTKIEKDIEEGNIDRGRYHIKEIDKSLLTALDLKTKMLGTKDKSVEKYRKKLEKIRKHLEESQYI
jgi:hypothetical protein